MWIRSEKASRISVNLEVQPAVLQIEESQKQA
jgi:hypothetical protein